MKVFIVLSGDTETDRRGNGVKGTPALWWGGKHKLLKRGELFGKSICIWKYTGSIAAAFF